MAAVAGAWVAAHRKLIVAVTGAAITLAIQVWGTGNPWVSFAILAATSLGVYGAPNQAPAPSASSSATSSEVPKGEVVPPRPEKTLLPPAAPE